MRMEITRKIYTVPKLRRYFKFRDKAVGIATGYGIGDRGVGFRVPVEQEFSLLLVVQTGSGAHPASYPMGTGGSLLESKAAGHETNNSPPTSARSRKCGSIHPIPHTPSWRNA
jgi:hypothetical protein